MPPGGDGHGELNASIFIHDAEDPVTTEHFQFLSILLAPYARTPTQKILIAVCFASTAVNWTQ